MNQNLANQSWDKMIRAKEHFQLLKEEIRALIRNESFPTVYEYDSANGHHIWKLANDPPSLARLSLIAGDCIHNLRSALDNMVCKLIIQNGNIPNNRNEFPIFDSEHQFNNGNQSKLVGISDNEKRTIRELKPYKNGNNPLWYLHRMDIIDKHRNLNLLVFAYKELSIPVTVVAGDKISLNINLADTGGLKKGAIVASMTSAKGITIDTNVKPEFPVDVIFAEEGLPKDEIILMLQAMMQSTDNALNAMRRHVG